MKKNNTIEQIGAAREKIRELAAEVAKAESEVVIAQERIAANHDDGSSDPAVVFERSEKARKDHGILVIVANRSAAKLAEAEDQLRQTVADSLPGILGNLGDTKEKTFKVLEDKLINLLGAKVIDHCRSEIDIIVNASEPVRKISEIIARINECKYTPGVEMDYLKPELLAAIADAAEVA